jgi:glycosyltransferase involved in cell wall biosynthesis
MSDTPVSAIIPVYNGAKRLSEAVASIRAQQHAPLEIVVVDDGSTDDTAAVAERLGGDVRCLRQANRGPSAARNAGLAAARGEYVGFLDVDDLWPTDKLRLQFARFVAEPELDVVLGRIQYLDLEGVEQAPMQFEGPDNTLSHVHLGSGLFRRAIFETVGVFDESLRFSEDHDWFLRAREKNVRMAILPEVTLIYRRHAGNVTRGKAIGDVGLLRVLKKSLDRRREQDGDARSLAPWSDYDDAKDKGGKS